MPLAGSILCIIREEKHLERCRWPDVQCPDAIGWFSALETLCGTQHWNNRHDL